MATSTRACRSAPRAHVAATMQATPGPPLSSSDAPLLQEPRRHLLVADPHPPSPETTTNPAADTQMLACSDQVGHRLVSPSPPRGPPGRAEQDAALAYPSSSPQRPRHGRPCRSTSVPFRPYKRRLPLAQFSTPAPSPPPSRPPRPPPHLD
nr:formin-like protein 13 [Lolium perenne]